MKADLAAVLAGVRALWARDRALLLPVAGLFLFVPQWAGLLLIPNFPQPQGDGAPAVAAWQQALSIWVGQYGAPYLALTVTAQFGALAIVALYLTPGSHEGGASGGGASVGEALRRALAVFLRYLLATVLVSLPLGLMAMAALRLPGGIGFVFLPVLYVLARTTLTGPAIVAERKGAMAAVMRSWTLTSGRGLGVLILVGGILIAGQVFGSVVLAADQALKGGNPLLLAVIDAAAAGVTAVAALALALVQVVLYRRLAR
jgi:hypothetical protein